MNDWILFNAAEQGVRTITLNRPEQRNALTRPMMQDIADAIAAAEADADTRCLLLNARNRMYFAS